MDSRDSIEVQELDETPEFGEELKFPFVDQENERKRRKKSFRKGLLTGMVAMLLVCAIATSAVVYGLSLNGYVLSSFKMDEEASKGVLTEQVQNKIAEVISALSRYYYDDLNQTDMANGMYKGLVSALGDKYTSYFTAEEYADYLNGTNGTYYGIGVVMTQDINTKVITISKVYDGSPAKEAGLMAEDILVSADGIKAEGLELSEFVSHVKGDEGTKVKLVINREGKEKTLKVERRKVEIPTINSQMLENKTGFIQITEFDQVTGSQFSKALKDLKKQGMKSLIVDLRGNPGGMISTVTDILDEILPKGLLVYTQDKSGEKTEYKSDAKELGMPLAVLVDGDSASASEIFAGAVKDYEYGTLIGTKTFGKGIVQVLLPLSDGSAVKMTTAKYFTPKGNYIHGVGIEPDIELEFDYQGDKDKDYDLMQDNQILKALEVLNKN